MREQFILWSSSETKTRRNSTDLQLLCRVLEKKECQTDLAKGGSFYFILFPFEQKQF